MMYHILSVLCLFAARGAIAADMWYCPGEKCEKCDDSTGGCPADIAQFPSMEDCEKNCPPEPDCYLCQNEECFGAHGMACFGQNAESKSQTMEQCEAACSGAKPDEPYEPDDDQIDHNIVADDPSTKSAAMPRAVTALIFTMLSGLLLL